MTYKDDSQVPDYPARLRLDGRNIVVVGAGQGMGRQTCHALRQCGARVLCVDVDERLAREMAAEVDGFAFTGDMTKEADVARLVADAPAQFGGPIHGIADIVGIAQWANVLDMDTSMWDSQFDLCLRHAYLLSRHVGRHMVEAGARGTLVFIASVHGLTASVKHAAYGAAKAGLISLVRTLAHELGPHGIRVNAVAPGAILTPRIAAALGDAEKQATAKLSPLNMVGTPSDIASAVLFLTSPLSAYMTGQTMVVDGGVVTGDPYTPL